MTMFNNIKKLVSDLGHQLSAKEELLVIGIEKEFTSALGTLANLTERVSNLEDVNKLALPKAKFLQQKLQGTKLNLPSEEKKEDSE